MYRKIFLSLLTTIIIFITGSIKTNDIEGEISKENHILISQEIVESDTKKNLTYKDQEELAESTDENKGLEIIKETKETDAKSDKKNNKESKEDKTTKNEQKNNLGLSTNEKVEIGTNNDNNKNGVQDIKKIDSGINNILVLDNKETKEDNSKNIEKTKENTSLKENTKKEQLTYKQNVNQSNYMVSEFNRITNNDSNFSAEAKELAKKGYSFYPYRESEIKKQIKNITFGDFYVYAEDVFLNGTYKRTIYYINFK